MASAVTSHKGKRQAPSHPPIQEQMRRAIARIAESDCPVLIAGEHGVGKRLIAEQIHLQSHRARGTYLELESGDADPKSVRSALASNGTVYLAEIGDLALPLQDLILETYLRGEPAQCCRLLFGTSRELREEVSAWRMREDFYYLVSAVTLHVSPLRCRKPELLSIADELLTQYSIKFDRPKPVLRKEIVQFLLDHNWPDNLPELQTAIQTFVAIGDQAVSLAALKATTPNAKTSGHRRQLSLKAAARAASTQIEQRLIAEVLNSTSGNRKLAAAELGISYKALLYKIKQFQAGRELASDRGGVTL